MSFIDYSPHCFEWGWIYSADGTEKIYISFLSKLCAGFVIEIPSGSRLAIDERCGSDEFIFCAWRTWETCFREKLFWIESRRTGFAFIAILMALDCATTSCITLDSSFYKSVCLNTRNWKFCQARSSSKTIYFIFVMNGLVPIDQKRQMSNCSIGLLIKVYFNDFAETP